MAEAADGAGAGHEASVDHEGTGLHEASQSQMSCARLRREREAAEEEEGG